MTDDRRRFQDFVKEARVIVSGVHGGDGWAAAADVRPIARSLALVAAVERSCPRRCACVDAVALGMIEVDDGVGLMAGIRHGVVTCKHHLATFEALPLLTADDDPVCDVCGGFSDRELSREVVPITGGLVMLDRLCEPDAAFLASTVRPVAANN